MNNQMKTASLNQVEEWYRAGRITEEELTEYLRAWNGSGKHITVAVFADGGIRNFDPETKSYKHLWEKYGITLS